MTNTTDLVVDVDYVLKHGDPRTESLPLMGSSHATTAITVLYVLFVKVLGPRWMKNKQAFELRHAMAAYNAINVLINVWIFLQVTSRGWFKNYSWRCEPIDFSDNEDAVQILYTCYVYFLTKYVEFADTIFMVLRKKNEQITFLHLFHHAFMPLASWNYVKYSGGGYMTILQFFNSFVHIWMYLYYLLSSMGPSVQKYIFWKKFLTELQLAQFIVGFIFYNQFLIFPVENCNVRFYPLILQYFTAVVFTVLFLSFYVKSYKKRGKSVTKNNK